MAITPWAAMFRRQLGALYGIVVQPPGLHFTVFDVLDTRLSRNKLTRNDVLVDLREGIYNVSLMDTDPGARRRYRMISRRLEIHLHVEPGRQPGSFPLTVLDSARRRPKGPPSEWHTPLVPSDVRLNAPRDATPCDLDELAERVKQGRRLDEAEQALTRIKLTPRRHADLRRDVMRRYGTLRTLVKLAKQRAEAGDTASGTAIVIDGHDAFPAGHPLADELVVRLDHLVDFTREDGAEFAIWAPGNAKNPMRLTLGDVVDDAVALLLPEKVDRAAQVRRRFPPGSRVVISETSDFRYRRHLYALQQFLDEEVTGNWTILATLLCRPENLAVPPDAGEVTPDRRPLNSEQRRAVAGALNTPHICCVQGPPGTGKTQVIADLVGRLTARGERVLLTAPTHVAVDEVLRRLADEPGVMPLRLSWKDSLVADDVQKFTKSGYDNVLAGQVRTPATSQLPQWQARLRDATEERSALAAWRTAADEWVATEGALDVAQTTRQANRRRQEEERGRAVARLARARAHVDGHAAAVTGLRAEDAGLVAQLSALEPTRGFLARLLDQVGLGSAGRLRWRRQRLERRMIAANEAFHEAARFYDAELRQHDGDTATLVEAAQADDARVDTAEQRRADAAARLEHAAARLSSADMAQPPGNRAGLASRLAELEAECVALAGRVDVQRRWFELLGMTGRDEEDDRQRGREVVGRALASAVNLVCSTTTGFGGDRDYRDLDYDTLIVDEASKVTGAEFLIPAIRARRWVLVGDEKQLPPHVEPRDEHHVHALAALHLTEREPHYTLPGAVDHLAAIWQAQDDDDLHVFRTDTVREVAERLLATGTWANAHRKLYSEQVGHVRATGATPEDRVLRAMREHLVASLFERCVAMAPDLTFRLVMQRRMPVEIAELVRDPVYGGSYQSPDRTADPKAPWPLISPSFPTPIVFLDTSSQPDPWDDQAGTSCINELEATWAAEVCRRWQRELRALGYTERTSISVLAFYGAQARLIRSKLGYPAYRDFPLLDFKVVDAVDRIQGQESDLVVISFCRTHHSTNGKLNEGYARWLQSINRLNVACTRARRSLVLIGHRTTLRRLNGGADAEKFYANMFGLGSDDGMTVRGDWAVTRSRQSRNRNRGRSGSSR